MQYIYIVVLTILLGGCAENSFSKYYRPYAQNKIKPTKHVDVIPYSNSNEITNKMEEGYRTIGGSSFKSSGNTTLKQLTKFAKSIGADIVMIHFSNAGSETYTQPIINYIPGTTSTTYANINAYGSDRYATANRTSTTYTSGTYSTRYVQGSRNWTSYNVIYLKKFNPNKRFKSGLWTIDKTAELNKKMGTNAGCLVQLVYKNTPAYYSDIFRGDVIMKINNNKIRSCKDINFKNFKNVSLELWRDGKIIQIQDMKLNLIN